MFNWRAIYNKILYLLLKIVVRSHIIPPKLLAEICLDIQEPMMYVLPYNSKCDLLTLRILCIQYQLPDPLKPIFIAGVRFPRYLFIDQSCHIRSDVTKQQQYGRILHNFITLYRHNSCSNIQILPVWVMFGRCPGKESYKNKKTTSIQFFCLLKKIINVIWLGRDSFIYFSPIGSIPISYIAKSNYTINSIMILKLFRLGRIHFLRQKRIAIGPSLLVRKHLFEKLLASQTITKLVEDEARSKKISIKQAQQKALVIIEEIAADFSYETIRLSDRVLSWIWNMLYQGLYVCNADRVRKLAEKGHEIIYLPCHRSHMDYLLLSYILYHEGLVIPYIAAGINLNFWPAGQIFRKLGAFFIHRTFKGHQKLYSAIFREYLYQLFNGGYSVAYFLEGSRSRTGRLQAPKTGTLTITIQSMLHLGKKKPIILVPVYISYEHVIEVASYTKELYGVVKKKEGLIHMISGLRNLRNLGRGYINFGEPLPLLTWLNQQVPQWQDDINSIEGNRPNWLALTVDYLAVTIMTRINNAVAVNAMNLCSSIILASRQYSCSSIVITRTRLLSQLKCYLELLRNVPYDAEVTVPNVTPEDLFQHLITLNQFTIKNNSIIYVSSEKTALITYYRNNIQHLFILPSLLAIIIIAQPGISRKLIHQKLLSLYPLLKVELFMRFSYQELPHVIDLMITELHRQDILYEQQTKIYPVPKRMDELQLLAASGGRETLYRYAITFSLLCSYTRINRYSLEKQSIIIAQHLSKIHSIYALEFIDKTIFSTLITTLRHEGYLSDSGEIHASQAKEIYKFLSALISPEIQTSITNALYHIKTVVN
ncbi:MAG: glycerol-3-phosphate 1-O-acyltransferase PlsB [Candidatus Baumannia cicadellinicola]|nr:glycerol-3-phosphate 1-O-acyltransferase PlsB [Candidatus Baumannia cicadellinicola]